MGEKKEKNVLPLGAGLLESLAKFQQIELEDVEISFDELELRLSPGMVMGTPQVGLPPLAKATPVKMRPTSLLETGFDVHLEEYAGRIVEVTLGATKGEGGSRNRTLTMGGRWRPPSTTSRTSPPTDR